MSWGSLLFVRSFHNVHIHIYTHEHTRAHTHIHTHTPEQNNKGKYTHKSHTSKLLPFLDDVYGQSADQKLKRDALLGPRCCPRRALPVPSSFLPSVDALRSLCLPRSPSPPPPPPRCTDTGDWAVFLQSPVFPVWRWRRRVR